MGVDGRLESLVGNGGKGGKVELWKSGEDESRE
jgi:hypothetical protein